MARWVFGNFDPLKLELPLFESSRMGLQSGSLVLGVSSFVWDDTWVGCL